MDSERPFLDTAPPVDWDDLKVFLALHRAGTIAGAASQLKASRSTVLRRLEGLHRSLGAEVIERSAEGLVLTEAGADLLPIAERIEDEALAAERVVSGRRAGLSGRLDLTVFEAGADLIAPVLVELRESAPELDLSVITSDRALSLHRRESDLALRASDTPDESLFGRNLGTLEYAVYGTDSARAQQPHRWILWNDNKAARGTEALARASTHPLEVVARVDSHHLMLALARAGAGVALLPVVVARSYPELEPIGSVPQPDQGIGVWILTHPDLRRSSRVREVMRFVAEAIGDLLKPSAELSP